MQYSVEIEINKPVDEVVKLFDNQENMDKWMEGLQSFELISGEPGQPGAKSRLKFKMGKRDIEMIETITEHNLPDLLTATYEAQGVYNKVKNKFQTIDGNRTKYITEQEFRFKGIMRLMAAFMPGAFKKQSMKYLNDFKQFAESNQI